MAILSKSQFNNIVENVRSYEPINTILREARAETKSLTATTIFLSHSHNDKEWIEKLVVFFRKLGIRIYVDWMDSTMPQVTNATTANNIKTKIKENKKFILLATNDAIASKWCNWELGFGDAQKYINHIALFPLSELSNSWTNNEYLRIYPYISKSNVLSSSSLDFEVIFPDGKKLDLRTWLKN